MNPDPFVVRVAKRLAFRILHSWRGSHSIRTSVGPVVLEFDSKGPISEAVYANAFERHERRILAHLLEPGDWVLDVGANIGFFTCLFAYKVGETGKVVAVEPTPGVFAELQRNVRLNGFAARVDCRMAALAEGEGVKEFHVFPAACSVYNSLAVTESYGNRSVQSIKVASTSVDRILSGVSSGQPVVLKVDVEGGEAGVINGGRESLSRLESVLLMLELNDSMSRQVGSSCSQTVDQLRQLGLQAFSLGREGKLHSLEGGGLSGDAQFNGNYFFLRGKFAERARCRNLL